MQNNMKILTDYISAWSWFIVGIQFMILLILGSYFQSPILIIIGFSVFIFANFMAYRRVRDVFKK